jgi:YjbE family integral membrane protein
MDPFGALLQVLMIDLVLAGDNAVVIGLAAAGLPSEQRVRAVLLGIVAATVLRVLFAVVATQLLQVVGLVLGGGVLLLWVSWKMLHELRSSPAADSKPSAAGFGVVSGAVAVGHAAPKSLSQAMGQIVVADVSMSLDNVLAVAGAARDHVGVLVIGLAMSIALMGVAATFIARLLQRHRWIGYVGLAIILYVALGMISQGSRQVWPVVRASLA